MALCAAAASPALAGALAPPGGPVAPTMKTLQQVEPRTPINSINTPGDNDATPSLFKITQSGSYYLTNSVTAGAGQICIEIAGVFNVEIDLNGYFAGDDNNGAAGFITVTSGVARVTLRNGVVEGYPFLINAAGGTLVIVEDVTVFSENALDTTPVIRSTDEAVVRRCLFSSGGPVSAPTATVENCDFFFAGIGVDSSRASVRDCTFRVGTNAVRVGSGSSVTGCSSSGMSGTAFGVMANTFGVEFARCSAISSSTGFDVGIGARVIECSTQGGNFVGLDRSVFERCRAVGSFVVGNDNTLISCQATSSAAGFTAGTANRFVDCAAVTCGNGGFSVGARSSFQGCSATSNTGPGFVATDAAMFIDCRADLNTQRGFSVTGDRANFTNCSATSNTTDGFGVRDGATFTNCYASDNGGDGFIARFGSRWDTCTARVSVGDGFESASGGIIRNCTADTNGLNAAIGANIRLTGDACRVEGNTLISADFGIQATAGGNVIIRNVSRNCPNDYGGIVAGNIVGTIVNSEAAMNAATNDNVNIEF